MRYKVKITTNTDPLNIRKGHSSSYSKVGSIPKGSLVIINDQVNVGSEIWQQLEDGRGWICHKTAGGAIYTTLVQNLDPPEQPPQPAPEDPPVVPAQPTPSRDYTDIEKVLNEGKDYDFSKYDINYNGLGGKTLGRYDYEELEEVQNNEGFPKLIGSDLNGVNIYDYFMDYSFVKNNLKITRENLNMHGDEGFNYIRTNAFRRFNRFKIAQPDYHLTKSFSYVFFTRPDLNVVEPIDSQHFKLTNQLVNEPTFYYLFKNNPDILISLTRNFNAMHDFHPFLSNTASSFELSDEYIKTIEHGETFTGYKVQYGKNNIESKTAGTFSVSYTDDHEFNVYKTHKAWIEYISKVYRGEIKSKDEYIRKKILDYACSVYYVICAEDGETILFWSKYYGVFPTNAPSSISSWSRGNQVRFPELSVNYAYAFKEDFSPLTLAEFNMNSRGDFLYKKIYEPALLSTGRSNSGAPFIETTKDGNDGYVFKLKFRYW